MGSGDYKTHLNFHLNIPLIHFHHHQNHQGKKDIPKGCVAITVGQGADQQRFIIPVIYINHPLFTELLEVAENEYGFDQKGPINIPCHVEDFRHVQGMIDKEKSHHHHQQVQHHHNQFLCFKA
ncbi:Auxin-responsive protein SAUR32 [Abeliophyllum distichum]|uniref:Auxin-responsive protein SAUR32 n=1 Tax=Abeliophyllum distichum TaxID=126358 RepID=A0ABD1VSI0_9LAMI